MRISSSPSSVVAMRVNHDVLQCTKARKFLRPQPGCVFWSSCAFQHVAVDPHSNTFLEITFHVDDYEEMRIFVKPASVLKIGHH